MVDFLETYIVDSFTNEPFKGNPAGVCLLRHIISAELMSNIARELGYSETAFVFQENERSNYSIRYFSPKMEIPLCGHATLAAAKTLFDKDPEVNECIFETIDGIILPVTRENAFIRMEFPIYTTSPSEVPIQMLEALGLQKFTNSVYNKETKILLLEIDDSHQLEQLSPDFESLKKTHDRINGVLLTAKSQRKNVDYECRYFWPWSGTNEDPVTGGIQPFLAPYWGRKLNKKTMTCYQSSARTGSMVVELLHKNALLIKGQAKIILKGELKITF